MKKAYLAIIYIITMVCVVIGLVNFTGTLGNISVGNFKFHLSGEAKGAGKEVIEIPNIADHIDITVDCNLADVKIMQGDVAKVEYRYYDGIEVNAECDEKHIDIKQINHNKVTPNNGDSDIIITIPTDIAIDNLVVTNNLGDIKMDGHVCYNIDITDNLGDIKLDDVFFDNIKVTDDLGDIKINSFKSLEDYTINAQVALGSLKINGKKQGQEFHVDGTTGTVVLEASLGDIKLNWK